MSEFAILIPIVVLLSLGVFIALRSGAGMMNTQTGSGEVGLKLVAGNFSALLFRVVGYLAVLLAVQGFVGYPSIFIW